MESFDGGLNSAFMMSSVDDPWLARTGCKAAPEARELATAIRLLSIWPWTAVMAAQRQRMKMERRFVTLRCPI